MSEAVLVVSEPRRPGGEPARCSPTAARARPGDQVTLADLEACLSEPTCPTRRRLL